MHCLLCYPVGLSLSSLLFRVYFFFPHDSRIARTHYTRKLHTLHFFFAFVSRSVPVKHVEGNRRRNGIAAWRMVRRYGAHRPQSHQPMILPYTL